MQQKYPYDNMCQPMYFVALCCVVLNSINMYSIYYQFIFFFIYMYVELYAQSILDTSHRLFYIPITG